MHLCGVQHCVSEGEGGGGRGWVQAPGSRADCCAQCKRPAALLGESRGASVSPGQGGRRSCSAPYESLAVSQGLCRICIFVGTSLLMEKLGAACLVVQGRLGAGRRLGSQELLLPLLFGSANHPKSDSATLTCGRV